MEEPSPHRQQALALNDGPTPTHPSDTHTHTHTPSRLPSNSLSSHSPLPSGVPGLALSFTEEAVSNHSDPWHPLTEEEARKATL